jgi:hypothetical protein
MIDGVVELPLLLVPFVHLVDISCYGSHTTRQYACLIASYDFNDIGLQSRNGGNLSIGNLPCSVPSGVMDLGKFHITINVDCYVIHMYCLSFVVSMI